MQIDDLLKKIHRTTNMNLASLKLFQGGQERAAATCGVLLLVP